MPPKQHFLYIFFKPFCIVIHAPCKAFDQDIFLQTQPSTTERALPDGKQMAVSQALRGLPKAQGDDKAFIGSSQDLMSGEQNVPEKLCAFYKHICLAGTPCCGKTWRD